MSLRVAWSLLSLLTWFRSKYQQFTGDNRFWSFLKEDRIAIISKWPGSIKRGHPCRRRSHSRQVLGSFCLLWAFLDQDMPQPAGILQLTRPGKKTWSKNLGTTSCPWPGPQVPGLDSAWADPRFRSPLKKALMFTRGSIGSCLTHRLVCPAHKVSFECSACCWQRNLAKHAFHGTRTWGLFINPWMYNLQPPESIPGESEGSRTEPESLLPRGMSHVLLKLTEPVQIHKCSWFILDYKTKWTATHTKLGIIHIYSKKNFIPTQ